MALRERGVDGKPQFEDAHVPLLQLSVIHVIFDNDSVVEIGTYQDDDEFGLCSWVTEEQLADGLDGIFRTRELAELPCGIVSNVGLGLNDRGNIADLTLTFEDGREILLVAGEVYEDWGSLRFCRDDESVLVFSPPSDAELVDWN
jgi:hypothetical protein